MESILRLKSTNQNILRIKGANKKKIITGFLFLILFTGYFFHKATKATPPPAPKLVETQILSTILIAKGSGLLDTLLPSGQPVKKGDLIAKIINPDIEKSYHLSKATAKIALIQYKRLKSLKKTGYVSTREVEEKKQIWIDAQKELAKTKIELKNMRFYAPFNGIIGAFKIKEGAQVNEAAAVVTVYDPSSLTVEVDIPCTNLSQIKDNQPVYIFNKPFKLSHMQKMIDDETHMCPADIDIHCEDCLVGANIAVQLVVKEKQNTLVIPTQALFLRDGRTCIYKIIDNQIELVKVETGIQDKDKIEIISGLIPGDQVIIKSPERLYPGLTVAIYQPTKDETKG
jgi:membrane fusion protein (multidrug efflux system)